MKYLRFVPTFLYLIWVAPRVFWTWLFRNKIPLAKKYALTSRVCRRLVHDFGIDLHVIGSENIPTDGNVIFMPNHQSMMDIVVLLAYLPHPIRFVAKIETTKMFYIHMFSDIIECRYLNREDMRGAVQFSRDITSMLINEKPHLMLFPEGTRTRLADYDVIDFKAGSYKIGLNAQSTLVPVAIFGTYKPLHKKIAQKRYRIDITFMKPYRYEDYKDIPTPQLANQFRDAIRAEIIRLRPLQDQK